jgi:hypothetical protein
MPKQAYGDMWSAYEEADLFLITSHSTLTGRGALVMSSGAALDARRRFSEFGIDRALGEAVQSRVRPAPGGDIYVGYTIYGRYHVLVSQRWPKSKLGLLQVRDYFGRPANLGLIAESCRRLAAWCGDNPTARVHLDYPGIDTGQLSIYDVAPPVDTLPDNVTVWRPTAPYEPDFRPAVGSPEWRIASATTEEDLLAVLAEIPRYRGDAARAKAELATLYSGPAREWWQRVLQYYALRALAERLDAGDSQDVAERAAWSVSRYWFQQAASAT